MQTKSTFSLTILLTLLSLNVFANTTNIYCPRNVTCAVSGDLSSCHLSNNLYDVWNEKLEQATDKDIIKGTYRLYAAVSGYETSTTQYCEYGIFDASSMWKGIRVFPKNYSTSGIPGWGNNAPQFIANHSAESLWKTPVNGRVYCDYNNRKEPVNPKSCPMTEVPEILYLKANQQEASGFYWDTHFNRDKLDYSTLVSLCGATSVCKVNIGSSFLYNGTHYLDQNYGTLTMDLLQPNTVTITEINPDPEAPCELKRKEPFNTVYCDYKKQPQL